MLVSMILNGLTISVEFCLSAFARDEITLIYFTGYRKIIMYLVQHFKAFSILLVYYYVGLNSQRKSSKKKVIG